MDYCGCGAPLDFSPDGIHCVGCYEALERRLERGALLLLFQAYGRALQAVIDAGADLRVVIAGRSRGVLHVEAAGDAIQMCSISSESPEEQQARVPISARFTVTFPAC